MYCARCGETVTARALVCKQCGNNLTRAGAIRMTAGALSTHENADVAGLGLPDDIFVRYRRDEDVPTRMIPAVPDEPDTGPDLDAEALHREHGRGIADMAIGDPGLDGQDVHDGMLMGSGSDTSP